MEWGHFWNRCNDTKPIIFYSQTKSHAHTYGTKVTPRNPYEQSNSRRLRLVSSSPASRRLFLRLRPTVSSNWNLISCVFWDCKQIQEHWLQLFFPFNGREYRNFSWSCWSDQPVKTAAITFHMWHWFVGHKPNSLLLLMCHVCFYWGYRVNVLSVPLTIGCLINYLWLLQ